MNIGKQDAMAERQRALEKQLKSARLF